MVGLLPRVLAVNATYSLWLIIYPLILSLTCYYDLWEVVIINSDWEIGGKEENEKCIRKTFPTQGMKRKIPKTP